MSEPLTKSFTIPANAADDPEVAAMFVAFSALTDDEDLTPAARVRVAEWLVARLRSDAASPSTEGKSNG